MWKGHHLKKFLHTLKSLLQVHGSWSVEQLISNLHQAKLRWRWRSGDQNFNKVTVRVMDSVQDYLIWTENTMWSNNILHHKVGSGSFRKDLEQDRQQRVIKDFLWCWIISIWALNKTFRDVKRNCLFNISSIAMNVYMLKGFTRSRNLFPWIRAVLHTVPRCHCSTKQTDRAECGLKQTTQC